MDVLGAFAMLIVLAIAIMAIVYFVRKQSQCPQPPAAVSFWATPDNSSVPTGITCPTGSVISVQNADYGAPWSNCAWSDVTTQAAHLLNGQNAYTIPAGTNTTTLLGVPDPCSGTAKIFAGSYVCAVTPPS